MNYPDVTSRCMKSHLYHVVFISTCNDFLSFLCSFYHCTAKLHTLSISTVYMYVCYV